MGSDSDLPVMEAAAKVLDRFGVPFDSRSALPTALFTPSWSMSRRPKREGFE